MISRQISRSLIKELLFGGNGLRDHVASDTHHRVLRMDVTDDLIAERKNSLLVAFFVFMNVNRRDVKGLITFYRNFLSGDVFNVFLDVNHQHVEMEKLFFLHTITFLHRCFLPVQDIDFG